MESPEQKNQLAATSSLARAAPCCTKLSFIFGTRVRSPRGENAFHLVQMVSQTLDLRRFAHLAAIAVPSDPNGVSILIPGSIGVRLLPILLQLRFELIIPLPMLAPVLGMGAIAESVGILDLLIRRLSSRGNGLLSSRLLDGIVHVLICVRLVAAKVVLCLVPIPLKGCFHFVPGRFMLLVPPFWISTLFHI